MMQPFKKNILLLNILLYISYLPTCLPRVRLHVFRSRLTPGASRSRPTALVLVRERQQRVRGQNAADTVLFRDRGPSRPILWD